MRGFTDSLLLVTLMTTAFVFCERENTNPVENRQTKEEKVAHNRYCADTIKVFTPEKGAVYHVGDTVIIRYCTDSLYQPEVKVSVNYGLDFMSLGYGNPFFALDTNAWSDCHGMISWVIPDSTQTWIETRSTASDSCLILIESHENPSKSAISPLCFRIVADE